jgi:hypothetical protein
VRQMSMRFQSNAVEICGATGQWGEGPQAGALKVSVRFNLSVAGSLTSAIYTSPTNASHNERMIFFNKKARSSAGGLDEGATLRQDAPCPNKGMAGPLTECHATFGGVMSLWTRSEL